MSSAGEIKNTLTLDATKFTSSLDRAEAGLESLDKHLQSATKAAEAFEAKVGALGGDLAGASSKFKLLDETVGKLVSRLEGNLAKGIGSVGEKTRKAKKDVDDLAAGVKKAGSSFLSVADTLRRYGESAQAVNPLIASLVKGNKELALSAAQTGKATEESQRKTLSARIEALNKEKALNDAQIAERKKALHELENINRALLLSENDATKEGKRYFGKNAAKGAPAKAEAAEYAAQSIKTKEIIGGIEAIVKELHWKNEELSKGVKTAETELRVLEEQLAVRRALKLEESNKALNAARELEAKKIVDAEAAAKAKAEEAILAQKKRNAKVLWEYEEMLRKSQEKQNKQDRKVAKATESESNKNGKEYTKWWKTLLDEQDAAERHSARERERLAKEVAATAIRAERERAAVAKAAAQEEQRIAKQTIDMWKGIGAMWAASKVGHGIASSVDSADKYQREDTTVKSMGLSKEETDYITKKSWDDSKMLQFASGLDVIKARMAGIGGLAHNNVEVLDALLPKIMKAAHNIQYMTGDKSQAGMENMVRNMFGVIEARGQTKDIDAASRSIDLVQKIYTATGKKIDIADLETLLRRDGPGADKLSDEGIAKLVSFMDAAKVSGGHGQGSAGAGVSTVGTATKMFQKMANGGLMTERAAKQFAESGLSGAADMIDTKNLDPKQAKNFSRNLREGGLNVAQLANADPVGALELISKAALSYMTKPENLKKYFGDANPQDPAAIKDAMMKFSIGTGWSTTGVSLLAAAGNKDIMDRSHEQSKSINNADNVDAMHEKVMSSYGGSMDKFSAAVENLKIKLGDTLLPMLSKMLDFVTPMVSQLAKFAEENPIVTAFDAIAVAGLTTLAMFKGMIGIVPSLGSVFSGLSPQFAQTVGTLDGVGVAASKVSGLLARAFSPISGIIARALAPVASALSPITAGFADFGAVVARVGVIASEGIGVFVTRLLSAFPSVTGFLTSLGAKFVSLFGGIAGVATRFGSFLGGFLTKLASPGFGWVVLSGQIGWMIGRWISDINIGGTTLNEKMQNTFLDMEVGLKSRWIGIQEKWADFKKSIGMTSAEENAAEKAGLGQERNALAQFDKMTRIVARKEDQRMTTETDPRSLTNKNVTNEEKSSWGKGPPEPKINPMDVDGMFGGKGKKDKVPRVDENAWANQYQAAQAKGRIEELKLDSVMSGESSYEEQAKAMFFKAWASGSFDDGKDPRKRKFIKGAKKDKDGNTTLNGKGFDPNNPWGTDQIDIDAQESIGNGKTASPRDMMKQNEEYLKQADIIKSLSFAKERLGSTSLEVANAEAKLTESANQQTDSMLALNQEFERLEKRTPGVKENSEYQNVKSQALSNRAMAEYVAEASSLKTKTEELRTSMTATEYDRQKETLRIQAETEDKRIQIFIDGIEERMKIAAETEDPEAYKKLEESRDAHKKNFSDYKTARDDKNAMELESPAAKMLRDWRDTFKQIQDLEKSFVSGFADNMSAMLAGQKPQWKSFFASIAKDISGILVKKSIGEGSEKLLGSAGISGIGKSLWDGKEVKGGGWAGGVLNSMREDKDGKVQGGGLKTMANSAMGWVKGKAGGAMDWAKGVLGGGEEGKDGTQKKSPIDDLMKGFEKLKGGVTDITGIIGGKFKEGFDAVMPSLGSLGEGVASSAEGLLNFAGDAISKAISAMAEWVLSLMTAKTAEETSAVISAFANGGIMTSSGPLPLNFYANGGIARSPQVSIWGEAGPEAYVPLPDGRSIPVTMKVDGAKQSSQDGGGGDQIVNINISVSNGDGGGDKQSQSGDSAKEWTALANKIKGVVKEEMVNQSRPGGILYK
jgi:hypothetical protein